MRPWITFFSQTGGEVANLATKLDRWPDLIITNSRPSYLRTIDPRIPNIVVLPNTPTLEDYRNILSSFDNPLITLHGWLRVVPEEICNEYEIYNGHPGLVSFYPDLKGKDPQYRAFANKYPYIGSIIHRSTSEVDGGEILLDGIIRNNNLDLNEIVTKLKDVSLALWLKFLTKELDEKSYSISRFVEYWKDYGIRSFENKVD